MLHAIFISFLTNLIEALLGSQHSKFEYRSDSDQFHAKGKVRNVSMADHYLINISSIYTISSNEAIRKLQQRPISFSNLSTAPKQRFCIITRLATNNLPVRRVTSGLVFK